MTETLATSPDPRCECCGRGADVAVRFPATANEAGADFQVCLRCVPLELRSAVVALPGHEQLVELMLGFADAHLPATTPRPPRRTPDDHLDGRCDACPDSGGIKGVAGARHGKRRGRCNRRRGSRGDARAIDRHQLHDLVGELARRLAVASSPPPPALEGDPGQQDKLCAAAAQLAAGMFGVPVECLAEVDRRRPVVDARAVAQSVARSFGLRLPTIGAYFGQHHITVLHALNKVEASPRLQHAAGQLREHLLAHRGAAA